MCGSGLYRNREFEEIRAAIFIKIYGMDQVGTAFNTVLRIGNKDCIYR